MSSILDNDKSYCIETNVSNGQIKDPVTGDPHEIDGYEGESGGTIEVERPDSARYLVDSSDMLAFVGKAPSAKAVKKAQKDAFGFSESELVFAFASSRNKTLGGQDLDAGRGFDPENDAPDNNQKMKVINFYDHLNEQGFEDEARYLRALPSLLRQDQFCNFLRNEHGINA